MQKRASTRTKKRREMVAIATRMKPDEVISPEVAL